jgi:signal transduction histidine kinase
MGQLAASIVHELNNPLMILIGYMDLTLMMKDQMPDDGNKYLNIARQQADSMNQLIRDISNLSKSQVTPFGTVQVNELITQLVVFLGSILRKNVKIDAQDLASGLPPDSAAPSRSSRYSPIYQSMTKTPWPTMGLFGLRQNDVIHKMFVEK